MPHKLATNEGQKLGAVVLAGGQGSRMNGLDKGMQLVYPNAKHLLPATRAFIDFVKPRLKLAMKDAA
jgi:molybdopterin-guanine dinucleotide biosynthesis protein A